MLNDSNVISLQISTAGIMQQIVWIESSSVRTVRTSVPVHGIPGIRGVRATRALKRLTVGRVEVHASIILSPEAKITVKCWQAMLCLVRYEEIRFTRTLESFATESPTVIAEFDSSLTGSGIVWYQCRGSGGVMRSGLDFYELQR